MTGKFIVFSGLDASGKTTNRDHVDIQLRDKQVDYSITREPGGTVFAERIRELLLSPEHSISPLSEVMMFYAARLDHTEKLIIPYLEKGYHVLCDRYYDSTWAYQSPICPEVCAVHSICMNHLRKPDMTILYDIPAELAFERIIKNRGVEAAKNDRFESRSLEYFNKVRDNFLNLAKDDPSYVVLDASRPLSEVLVDTWNNVKTCLGIEE